MRKRNKSNTIRIISGKWRGSKVNFIPVNGLRPTSDRVRETLFNWLMHDLQGARCCDVFAGSGVLGLESLSRGASFVHFIEKSAPVAQQIQYIATRLYADNVVEMADNYTVQCADALHILTQQPAKPYNVIFLDPPFAAQNTLLECMNFLEQKNWLADGAWIYVEHDSSQNSIPSPKSWQLHRQGVAGQSAYKLYQRVEPT